MIVLKIFGHILFSGLLILAQVVYWAKVQAGKPLADPKKVPPVVAHSLLWLVWSLFVAAEIWLVWRDLK